MEKTIFVLIPLSKINYSIVCCNQTIYWLSTYELLEKIGTIIEISLNLSIILNCHILCAAEKFPL